MTPACRLFGILAVDAPVAVLLRRGPTNWVEMIRWDTAHDTFERGQWFHGRIFERRSDLSADGRYLVYFADKRRGRSDPSYGGSWTVISRPPFFTALTLWPKGDCWDGGGRFERIPVRRERPGLLHLHLNHPGDPPSHPDHPVPKSLRVHTNRCGRGEDMPIYNEILRGKGWTGPPSEGTDPKAVKLVSEKAGVWTRRSPDGRLVLRMELEDIDFRKPGGPLHFGFSLHRAAGDELVEIVEAQWADWDQAGRLVFSQAGKLFAARPTERAFQPTELADFTADRPTRLEAPDWATRW